MDLRDCLERLNNFKTLSEYLYFYHTTGIQNKCSAIYIVFLILFISKYSWTHVKIEQKSNLTRNHKQV